MKTNNLLIYSGGKLIEYKERNKPVNLKLKNEQTNNSTTL
jgi:hypothetical protein